MARPDEEFAMQPRPSIQRRAVADTAGHKVGMADEFEISVVIIFLNAEHFIAEAIASVLAQTYERWELLLVDDGSSDGSTAIARRYAAEYPGRIRYLEQPGHENRGMSAARNLGIAEAKGLFKGQVFLSKMCLQEPVYVVADCLDRYRQHPDSSCRVAERRDGYNPARPNPMKLTYLEWLEAYIAGRGIDDARLAKALQLDLLAYRSPLRYRIATAPRRVPYALKVKLRRLGLLPPPRRQPLPI